MNGIKYLVDTCTLIGLHKQSEESLNLFSEKQVYLSQCGISIITYMEYIGFYGIDKWEAIKLEKNAKQFFCYSLSPAICDLVISIRQRHKIKLPDCIVLATALNNHLELLTLDTGLKNKFLMETGII